MKLDLAVLAKEGLMIPDASIKASRSITIEASTATVWAILTNVLDWPRWHAHLVGARLDGPFAPGSRLTYGRMIKHRLAIADVKTARRVMIHGTLGGYVGITRWDIEPVGANKTRVTFTESSAGPLIALLYGTHRLGGHLERWLAALKLKAER